MRRYATVLLTALVCSGCVHTRHKSQVEVEYVTSSAVPGLKTLQRSGDFALYYDGDRKPEIPVRLRAGEEIGFVREHDGRVEAVAGAFRMHLAANAGRAYWKRLSPRED